MLVRLLQRGATLSRRPLINYYRFSKMVEASPAITIESLAERGHKTVREYFEDSYKVSANRLAWRGCSLSRVGRLSMQLRHLRESRKTQACRLLSWTRVFFTRRVVDSLMMTGIWQVRMAQSNSTWKAWRFRMTQCGLLLADKKGNQTFQKVDEGSWDASWLENETLSTLENWAASLFAYLSCEIGKSDTERFSFN